jgi:hypothetical protein
MLSFEGVTHVFRQHAEERLYWGMVIDLVFMADLAIYV